MTPLRASVQDVELTIRKVSEQAATMDDVVRLDIGQPDFGTPPVVTERMTAIVRDEEASYTSLRGIKPLREAIAGYESRKVPVEPDRVTVTTGGTGGLYCLFNALLDSGETILANDPSWPPYRLIGQVSPGGLDQVAFIGDDGSVNADAVRDAIHDGTQALLVNTPENPTGRVYTREQLETLGGIAAEHDLTIIADEVYDRLVYGREHVSIADLYPDRTVIVNSVSKSYAMTGWRVGWVAAPTRDLAGAVGKVNRATTACPNAMGQHAARIALQEADDYVAAMRETYHERRDYVLDRIHDLGWDCVAPDGAIYAFPDTGRDAWDVTWELLDEAGVAVVPGTPHGDSSGTHIRLCFGSADRDALEDGFDRIAATL